MKKLLSISLFPFIVIFSSGLSSSYAQNTRVCMHLKSQSLQQGKILTTEADQYFSFPEGKVVTYFTKPQESVFMSNVYGEARIYYPAGNKLMVQSRSIFTTKNNSLYYFLTNQLYDLGMKEMGLEVYDSEEDGNLLITRWQAPIEMLSQVDKIELVHENMLPIFTSYRNTKGDITLKVYFEDFSVVSGSQVPNRITEIIYLPEGDSIIKRTDFTDIRSGTACDESKFNFEIPENAVITK